MRYAVLVVLGSFGLVLLYIAHYRYQVVNLELAALNTVEGIVESLGPDGELNLKYSVGSTEYRIVRSVPVKFPRIHPHDAVTLLFNPSRPDTAKVRQWSVVYQDSAVSGGFGVLAILMAAGAFVAMGNMLPATLNVRPAQRDVTTPVTAALEPPIELHNARDEFYISLAMSAGAMIAAYFLYRNPWFLWTRWLAYPAAVAIGLFGIGMIFAAFQNQTVRIRADSAGVSITDSENSRHFRWEEVTALKRETVNRSTWQSGKYFTRGYQAKVMGRYLILSDGAGKELLKLDEDVPMVPFQDWLRLRGSIPARTGLTVQEVTRESLL